MPTISELIYKQHEFQEPRGLNKFNTPKRAFERFMEEVEEMYWEIAVEDENKALEELVDVFIIGGAIALSLCHLTGKSPEEFEAMVHKKFSHNEIKYDQDFFNNGLPLDDALRIAKHWWDLGLHEDNWHSKEDF